MQKLFKATLSSTHKRCNNMACTAAAASKSTVAKSAWSHTNNFAVRAVAATSACQKRSFYNPELQHKPEVSSTKPKVIIQWQKFARLTLLFFTLDFMYF